MACGSRTQPGNMALTFEGDRGPSAAAQAPEKLYTRWKRWSDKGIFAKMMAGLADEHGEKKTVMIDATCLKTHRTASSLGVKVRRVRKRSGGSFSRRTGVDA